MAHVPTARMSSTVGTTGDLEGLHLEAISYLKSMRPKGSYTLWQMYRTGPVLLPVAL